MEVVEAQRDEDDDDDDLCSECDEPLDSVEREAAQGICFTCAMLQEE